MKIKNKKNNIKKIKNVMLKFFIFLGFFMVVGSNSVAMSIKEQNNNKILSNNEILEKNFEFYKDISLDGGKDAEYYNFKIDDEIRENSNGNYRDILLINSNLNSDQKNKDIPYYIYSRKGKEECSEINVPYNKIYQKDIKGGVEVLLDFKKSSNTPYKINLSSKEQEFKFSASYEVFGSDLKNSKYTKINKYNSKYNYKEGKKNKQYGVIYDNVEENTIDISQKYRYIKILFKADKGKIGNLVFTKKEQYCDFKGGDYEEFKTLDIENINNTNNGDLNKEIIKDLGRKSLSIDRIIFTNEGLEDFYQRNIKIFGSNSENSLDYTSNKRYDSNKQYWKLVSEKTFYGNKRKSWNIEIKDGDFRYYKIIISGGEKDIDFDIKFKALKEFLVFKNDEFIKGEDLKLYFGARNVKINNYYNDLKSEIDDILQKLNNDGGEYIDIISETYKVKVGKLEKNTLFVEENKITKNEQNLLMYFVIFVVMLFLGWYLVRIFKTADDKK